MGLGEKVYKAQCTSCHGASPEGQPEWRTRGAIGLLPAPPHDASGHTWHHPDETLFRITKYGVANVAGIKDQIILESIRALEMRYPEVDEQRRKELLAILEQLITENPARH